MIIMKIIDEVINPTLPNPPQLNSDSDSLDPDYAVIGMNNHKK